MTDYTSIEELAEHLRIDDQDDGPVLASVITASSRAIDRYCGQFFYDAGSATARTFRADSPQHVAVHPFSTTTGLLVATDDGNSGTYSTSWTIATDFVVTPDGSDITVQIPAGGFIWAT